MPEELPADELRELNKILAGENEQLRIDNARLTAFADEVSDVFLRRLNQVAAQLD